MKIYIEDEFINLVRKDINPLSFKDFVQTKQISNLWDKLEFDDIRIKSLKTKEEFYKWCYDFIHNDEPLKVYFRKRLSYNTQSVHEEVPIQNIKNIKDSIIHISNNSRYIKNINLPSILDCRAFDGKSIKNIYKDALELGKIDRCITMPSVFKDSYNGNYDTFVVTMKTISGQMSIFSPVIYNMLLNKVNGYLEKKDKCKILIPSASWGSPIIATLNEEKYSDIHIVDVQQAVLNVCEDIFNDYVDKPFRKLSGIKPPYNLKTFCVPSENMTEVIDNNYDTVFFCPPYYDLELYGGSDLQSTTLYQTYEEWLDLYWRKTVNECHKVLKSDGMFCFIMGRFCRGYEMGNDMKKIAAEKFNLIDEIKILPPQEVTRNNMHLDKYEVCYIMKGDR